MGEKRRCWKCGAVYSQGEKLCSLCGIDLLTGKKIQPGSIPERPPVEEPATPGERRIALVVGLLPGLLRPAILILSFLAALLGIAVTGLGVVMLLLAPISAVGIAAVGMLIYAQAIAWMILGEFMMLQNALAEFDGKCWAVFWTLLCSTAAVAFLAARVLFPP